MDDSLNHKIALKGKRGIKKNTGMENPKQARICFKSMNVKQIYFKKNKNLCTHDSFKVQNQQAYKYTNFLQRWLCPANYKLIIIRSILIQGW